MRYTPEQKAEAVALYIEHGPDHAAQTIGCSRRIIYDWLGRYCIDVQDEKREARHRETQARHQAKREALREAMIDAALAGATAINPQDPKGCQALAISVGILLDKYRLEMGETTSRSEVLAPLDLELVRIADEFKRLPA